jgi:hypothetical protein
LSCNLCGEQSDECVCTSRGNGRLRTYLNPDPKRKSTTLNNSVRVKNLGGRVLTALNAISPLSQIDSYVQTLRQNGPPLPLDPPQIISGSLRYYSPNFISKSRRVGSK